MSAGIGLGMGDGKERGGGFKMDLCKRRRLQCERSVVHSGKSLSHALSVEQRGTKKSQGNREHVQIESYVFEAGCRRPQRQPQHEARQ